MLTYASAVPAIHNGLGTCAFEKNRADKVLKEAKQLLADNKREEALSLLEATLRDLELDLQAAQENPTPERARNSSSMLRVEALVTP